MSRSILRKTIATAAAFGSVLALGSLTVAPASAASSCYTTTTTYTSVSLTRSIGQYGDHNRATVNVTHDKGNAVPGGTVRIFLSGSNVRRSWTIDLTNGRGSVALPSGLPSQATYRVRAKFPSQGCDSYSADNAYYSVTKASTLVTVHGRNIKRGGHPRVVGHVASTTGRVPHGHVTVALSHRGHVYKTKTVRLDGGYFTVYFGRTKAAGKWLATARYSGAHNYNASKNVDRFRVYSRR